MPMASNDAGPIHRVRVDGFWMDATVVTNAQFEKFVKATGYVTIAALALGLILCTEATPGCYFFARKPETTGVADFRVCRNKVNPPRLARAIREIFFEKIEYGKE
jgi:formylglycine-generating enzyme required for sulfatase activity